MALFPDKEHNERLLGPSTLQKLMAKIALYLLIYKHLWSKYGPIITIS